MSLARVHNFSISLDGFGSGEPQSLDAPFGHAGQWPSLAVMATPPADRAGRFAGYAFDPDSTYDLIDVGLAHPRTQAATRSSAGFLAVRNAIHDAIARQQGRRGEVR